MNLDRLLILGCSQKKRADTGLLPAVERYDGPAFRVLRKYMSQKLAPPTWILSAEYGLIPADMLIPDYDRQMTTTRAQEIWPQVKATLEILASNNYSEVLVCAGQKYVSLLAGLIGLLSCPITYTSGPVGRHLAILHDWLHEAPPASSPASASREVRFRGQSLRFTSEEVLVFAQEKAIEDPAGASRYAGWYVSIGELRVAPKWLINQLTGVPVSEFRTADAIRILSQLGIKISRTKPS